MSTLTLRPAAVNDAADIHTLLLRLAAEIPLAVETLDQEEALYATVRKILSFGQSWVTLDGGAAVGVVLVDAAEVGRHWAENELLNLCFAAGEGVEALLARVLERNVPITAAVREANTSGLAALLATLGFHETEARVGEHRFRREP